MHFSGHLDAYCPRLHGATWDRLEWARSRACMAAHELPIAWKPPVGRVVPWPPGPMHSEYSKTTHPLLLWLHECMVKPVPGTCCETQMAKAIVLFWVKASWKARSIWHIRIDKPNLLINSCCRADLKKRIASHSYVVTGFNRAFGHD